MSDCVMRHNGKVGYRGRVMVIRYCNVTKFSSWLVNKYRCNYVPTPKCQMWLSFVAPAPGMVGGKKERKSEQLLR